jgi:hypothetical protein
MPNDNIRLLVQRSLEKQRANEFRPTDAQRRAKSAYWSHYFQTGDIPPDTVSSREASELSGYSEVEKWYSQEGFPEWFQNGDEFRQQVEYTSHLGLEVIQQVLQDVGARTSDRLNAAKMALEIAAKFPSKSTDEKYADKRIQEMGKKELEELIASKLKKVTNQ